MISEAVHAFVVGVLLPINDALEPVLGAGPAFVATAVVLPISVMTILAFIAHRLDGERSPWR